MRVHGQRDPLARLTLSRSSGCVQQAAPHDAIPPKYQRDIRFSVISPVSVNLALFLAASDASCAVRCRLRVWISLIFREVKRVPVLLICTRHHECVACVTGVRGQTKFTSSQLVARNLERPPGAPDPPPTGTHTLQYTKKEENIHATVRCSLRASAGLLKRQ